MTDQQLASLLLRQRLTTVEVMQQVIERRAPEQGLAEALVAQGVVTADALQQLLDSNGPRETAASVTAASGQEDAAAVRVVDALMQEGVMQGASDIHLEPRDDGFYLRYRMDGLLRDPVRLDGSLKNAIVSRVKVLANLDLAESRLPQDGRFRQTFGPRVVDFRVSTLPTEHGEKVVLRILDTASVKLGLDQLGMDDTMRQQFEQLILRPQGMILVTGPTGSGKSTTLYAALRSVQSETKNVVTVEDPVEYRLHGINQTAVNPRIGLTFARQLRAILRQDPDVILVGEIRDAETAEMAFRAALTGHLVLSTLHTNDAPSAMTRLVDMGVAPYLIVSSVLAVLAQRLVRVLCPECKSSSSAVSVLTPSAFHPVTLSAVGCSACGNTGYRGRVGVYELLMMTEPIRQAVMHGASASEIRELAMREGMTTLADDGSRKVGSGVTTAEEVMRVVGTTGHLTRSL